MSAICETCNGTGHIDAPPPDGEYWDELIAVHCPACQPERDVVEEVIAALGDPRGDSVRSEAEALRLEALPDALRKYVADLRARAASDGLVSAMVRLQRRPGPIVKVHQMGKNWYAALPSGVGWGPCDTPQAAIAAAEARKEKPK